MFGYINVYKNELKIKEYNIFRAYYCGLCKALGKRYNQLVRLGLSYDMTFLALLADSLYDQNPYFESDGCIKHIGKHMICKNNNSIDFCADASIILYYHKLTDDIRDDHSVKAFLARLAYRRAIRKASRKHPELSQIIRHNLSELSRIENGNCDSVDMAAHPFAELTSRIFETANKSLKRLGYDIGRFIYIIDAANDVADDIRNNSYNPFVSSWGREFVESENFASRALGSLNMTLASISRQYQALSIKKHKAILDNIIYMGLRNASEKLFSLSEDKSLE